MSRTLTRITTTKTYLKPGQMQCGQTIKGLFQGTSVDEKYGNNKHSIVPEGGGDEVVLNGCGTLDRLMAKVPVGAYVEVTYKGVGKSPSGKFKGKDRHEFDVAADLSAATQAPVQPPAEAQQVANVLGADVVSFAPDDEAFPFEKPVSPTQRVQNEMAKFNTAKGVHRG